MLDRHENAPTHDRRHGRILLERNAMCAQDDIGVWQTALQLLDDCPLLRSSHFGVLAPHDHVAWCHGFADVFWELREVLAQTLGAIMHVSWPVATGRKYLVGDRFDSLVHREDAGSLPRLLFLRAVQSDPLSDEALRRLAKLNLFQFQPDKLPRQTISEASGIKLDDCWPQIVYKLFVLWYLDMAERVGFEPTCPLRDNTLSRRARYDHFGTSPHDRLANRSSERVVTHLRAATCQHYGGHPSRRFRAKVGTANVVGTNNYTSCRAD